MQKQHILSRLAEGKYEIESVNNGRGIATLYVEQGDDFAAVTITYSVSNNNRDEAQVVAKSVQYEDENSQLLCTGQGSDIPSSVTEAIGQHIDEFELLEQ